MGKTPKDTDLVVPDDEYQRQMKTHTIRAVDRLRQAIAADDLSGIVEHLTLLADLYAGPLDEHVRDAARAAEEDRLALLKAVTR